MEATQDQEQPATFSTPFSPTFTIELERKIACRTAGRIRDLKVETDGSCVILWGRTSTYYIKQLATQIALAEAGETSLRNSIDVL